MKMRWIDKTGTLRIDGITYSAGDEIPKGALSKERIKTFKELKQIETGDFFNPDKDDSLQIENEELKKEISELKKENKSLVASAKKMLKQIEKLEASENEKLSTPEKPEEKVDKNESPEE